MFNELHANPSYRIPEVFGLFYSGKPTELTSNDFPAFL
jgi:hypothetical protein